MAQVWRQRSQEAVGQGPGQKKKVLDQSLVEKGEGEAGKRDAQEA